MKCGDDGGAGRPAHNRGSLLQTPRCDVRLIDELIVDHQGSPHAIQLFLGDLAAIPPDQSVDLLIVSAFPDDYTPTGTSLIGALVRQGVSVARLAENKAVDLREFSSCWLSHPLQRPDVHFRRVLCFEPLLRGSAPEVVGDIFRSLVPFTTGSPPITSVAMPVVASGDQGEPPSVMLEAITSAAAHWLSIGIPLDAIKIVIRKGPWQEELTETFAHVKRSVEALQAPPASGAWRYDVFISYAHQDRAAVEFLVEQMRHVRAGLRVFMDRLELQLGMAWQQELFEVLDECRKVVTVLSNAYVRSKVCKEEFNIALFRHRDSPAGVLLPVYLQSAPLPTYMKLLHYEDAREFDRDKMVQAAQRLVSQLASAV